MGGEVITIDLDFKRKASLHAKIMRVMKAMADCLYIGGCVYVRKSSSGFIHIRIEDGNYILRELYDDQSRLKVSEIRAKHGMRVKDLLFDRKGNKKAGEWQPIRDFRDAERFIREFFRLNY